MLRALLFCDQPSTLSAPGSLHHSKQSPQLTVDHSIVALQPYIAAVPLNTSATRRRRRANVPWSSARIVPSRWTDWGMMLEAPGPAGRQAGRQAAERQPLRSQPLWQAGGRCGKQLRHALSL